MIDIIDIQNDDLNMSNTQAQKAANVLRIQIGSLEYAQDFGIDLRFFLSETFKFQNESFRAYIIERLAVNGINVSSVQETVETLFSQYTINLGPESQSSGLVAR